MNKIILLFINLTFLITCANAQNVGIGTTSPAASAALDINSVTGGVLLPRMTNTQRNALTPVEGMMIYNTDFSKFQGYGLNAETYDAGNLSYNVTCTGAGCGTKWQSFTQGSSTGILTSIKMYFVANFLCLPTTVTVKIRSGTGISGAILQTSSVIIQTIGYQLATVPFHAAVTSGSVYTIEFSSPSTGCNGSNDNVEWAISNINSYTGGSCFCCTALINQDFAFQTFIGNFGWVNLY